MPQPNDKKVDSLEEMEEEATKEMEEEGSEESCSDEESDQEGSSDESSDGEEEDSEEEEEEGESGTEDEESGSDAEDDETECQDAAMDTQAGYDSDQSDGTSEKCPICLGRFSGQAVGNPESCDHSFCLECIVEWSKNVNTCPVDRQVFRLILARHSLDGEIYKKIPVADAHVLADEEDDLTYCEICGQCDREDRMLLCDGCDLGYHMDCLDPPLTRVPVEEWFCHDCEPEHLPRHRRRSLPEDDVVLEVVQVTYIRQPGRRRIARTRVSERVRATIARRRANRIVSDDEELETETTQARASTSTGTTARRKTPARRKKTTRRRKTRKRKKTTKRKTTATGKKRKTRRRKKRTKKTKGKSSTGKARTAKDKPSSIKSRLAGRLGISKPPPGRTMPLVRSRSERTLAAQRYDMGSALSIFGSRDELDSFGYDSEEGSTMHGDTMVARPSTTAIRRGLPTKSALQSHRSLDSWSSARRMEPVAPPAVSSGFDLLGSILMGQELLSQKSEDVTIKRDGSLEFKKRLAGHKGKGVTGIKGLSKKSQQTSRAACDDDEGTGETSGGNEQQQSSGTNNQDQGADTTSSHAPENSSEATETDNSGPSGHTQGDSEEQTGDLGDADMSQANRDMSQANREYEPNSPTGDSDKQQGDDGQKREEEDGDNQEKKEKREKQVLQELQKEQGENSDSDDTASMDSLPSEDEEDMEGDVDNGDEVADKEEDDTSHNKNNEDDAETKQISVDSSDVSDSGESKVVTVTGTTKKAECWKLDHDYASSSEEKEVVPVADSREVFQKSEDGSEAREQTVEKRSDQDTSKSAQGSSEESSHAGGKEDKQESRSGIPSKEQPSAEEKKDNIFAMFENKVDMFSSDSQEDRKTESVSTDASKSPEDRASSTTETKKKKVPTATLR